MKHIFLTVLAALFGTLMIRAQVARDLTLRITDEAGAPLSGAQATISFAQIGGWHEHKGATDGAGEFNARAQQTFSTDVFAEMPGHYGARIIDLARHGIRANEKTLKLVLPSIQRPTALCSLRTTLEIPVHGRWLGYDLQVGQWLPPYGKGVVADIQFNLSNEFLGYLLDETKLKSARELSQVAADRSGRVFSEADLRLSAGKWRGVLEISFPDEREGIVRETERYWFYGELRLPHFAPEDGYQPALRYESNTYEPRPEVKPVGFFLRTRVRLDPEGRIVSANYGKIYDDFAFDARGTVSFWYYFNPVPNDRNLEFDPKRNLLPGSMRGTNVSNP